MLSMYRPKAIIRKGINNNRDTETTVNNIINSPILMEVVTMLPKGEEEDSIPSPGEVRLEDIKEEEEEEELPISGF